MYEFSLSDTDYQPLIAKAIFFSIISALRSQCNVTVFFSESEVLRLDFYCNRSFSFKNGVKPRFFKHSLKQNAPFWPVWYTNTVSPPHGKTAEKTTIL